MTDNTFIGLGLAQAFSLFMTVSFLCYVVTIVIPYLRHRPRGVGDPTRYEWHFFIPARDEALVIHNTVDMLRLRFPEAHVWVIDDASLDATGAIVADMAARDDRVHVVSRQLPEARTGKGDALNSGYDELNTHLARHAAAGAGVERSRVIVGVIDADGMPAANCLEVISADHLFGQPDVGAVQISVRMVNRNERQPFPEAGRVVNSWGRLLVRMQDLEFRAPISAVQMVRQHTRSVGLGGNGQFSRLSALDAIAGTADQPWHGSLLEDYELGLHLIMAGYQNEFTTDTLVDQEGLPNLRRLLTQRTRWGQGTMQCGSYLPKIWSSRHFTTYGALEASYYLIQPWLQLFATLVYPLPLIVLAHNIHVDPAGMGRFFLNGGWMLILFYLVVGIAPFVLWGPLYAKRCEPGIGRLRAIGFGLAFSLFIITFYITTWRAFFRILSGRRGWAKTRRNTDVQPGRVALEA
ncbi:MAG: glycosyltransferase family 2 protein [Ornithinibacter sp.]